MARHEITSDATLKRDSKPQSQPFRVRDGDGLYLLVNPNGSRWWRFDYTINGKRKTISLGIYPDTGLAAARRKAEEARQLVAEGIDPSGERKKQKAQSVEAQELERRISEGIPLPGSFEEVAREYHAKYSPNWTENHAVKILTRMERDIFPWIGNKTLREITALDLLTVLRRIEARGVLETTHRIKQYCGQVFRYGIATGRADRDPSADLRGALPPVKQKHHPTITDTKQIGELLRAIDAYQGSFTALCALKLAPLVFVRPGELRHAEWQEIDLDKQEWRIPAAKMKMREVHIVPLSRQAVAVLQEIQPLTGHDRYVFPSERGKVRPMSENTVTAALRRMGYAKGEMTGHGFRSMASTLLNEQGWHRDAIERQLAHAERDNVRAAYNYAQHLPERRKMMQAWADYLDGLKKGADVVPIRKAV